MSAACEGAPSVRAPGLRTVTPANAPQRHARRERRGQAGARSSTPTAPDWPEPFASARARLRSRNDAPLIGERAATRGRIATEGGDEHAGVKRAFIRSNASLSNRIERQEGPTPARPRRTTRPGARPPVDELRPWELDDRPHSPTVVAATARRSSANAPRRAGAVQRKVAMSRPVRGERYPPNWRVICVI